MGGSRAGPRSGGEKGAHIEVAADRGEQRQLKRRQRAVVVYLIDIPTRARRTIPSRVSLRRARWAVAEAAVGAYLPCVLVSTVYKPQLGAAHRAKSSGALLQYYPRSIRLLEEDRSRGEYV